MINIINSDRKIIDDTFYDAVHQFAALDFEVGKYNGKLAQKGSSLERIRAAHQRLSQLMEEKQAIISPIPTPNQFDIAYKLTYQGQEYLLDSEEISKIIKRLG
ncbi:hypothetical protein [Haemophilus influenzae]|uniref:hypothetical protein n=1 Tax=Haemophilus influenzae TaxID=727 RepID=UPI0005AEEDAE|nr:hypothetical protein [Haemophilus influenzae]KIP36740.1 hypothetical protein SU51_00220 [Haemophilus influenzae]